MVYVTKAPTGSAILPGDIGAFKPEWWSTDLLRYRRSNLVMLNYLKKISFMGKAGDRIRLPRIGRLGVRPLVPGNPVHLQSRAETEWYMYIDRYMESSFAIHDLTRIQANANLRSIYTEEAGRALAEDLENFALGYRAATIGYSGTSHVSTTSPIAYADILSANTILDKRKVPTKNRVLVIGPAQKASMFNENKFISSDYSKVANIDNGVIGEIMGIPVVVTNHMLRNSTTGYQNGDDGALEPTPAMTSSPYYPTQLGDTTDVYTATSLTASYYSATLWHGEHLALAMQKMPSVDADWNTDYQEYHVVQTQLYAAKLYRVDHGCVISSDDDNLI